MVDLLMYYDCVLWVICMFKSLKCFSDNEVDRLKKAVESLMLANDEKVYFLYGLCNSIPTGYECNKLAKYLCTM